MSRTFFRKFLPAVPRAAGRPASRASALRGGEFGYYTRPRRGAGGKPARTQDADNSGAAERRGLRRRAASGWRFAPPRMRAAPQPRRFAPAHRRGRFSFLYISKEIGARLRAGGLPRPSPRKRRFPLSLALPHSPSSNSSRRRGSLPEEERPPPGPPAFRAGNPLSDRPWSILYVGVFPSLRYLRSLGATAYSNAQAFPPRPILHMYAEAPLASFLKPKRRVAADAALFLNRYIWRQSYASLKNFFLPT